MRCGARWPPSPRTFVPAVWATATGSSAILPNVAEAVVGLLAAASIGAIWSVCAPEFGPGAIVSRFAQLGPKVVIAAPGYRLGGKDRDRQAELGEIFAQLPPSSTSSG